MSLINHTENGALAYNWEKSGKNYICEIFSMSRGAPEIDIISKLPIILSYDKKLFIALMFHIRGIRVLDSQNIPKGKGERLISYHMVLWLLKNDLDLFLKNYNTYITILGYYKDCLLLAKLAYHKDYTNQEIELLLMPLAMALMDDENKIIQKHLNPTNNEIQISLASKWAPREGKAFSTFIHHLKKLCNITGKKTNMKWRKFIQQIIHHKKIKTIETLLSTKQYDLIEFKAVPSKAFNLYKKSFESIPELTERYSQFLKQVFSGKEKIHTNAIYPHEFLKDYLINFKKKDDTIEAQWKCYIDNAITNSLNIERVECNFIPMIDLSGSMFMQGKCSPGDVAITIGILMSIINTGKFNRKALTFSSTPIMMDILGNTAFDQITSLYNAISKEECGSMYNTNFIGAFDELLNFILKNEITLDEVKNLKIIAFSDMEFDAATSSNTTPLEEIRAKYAKHDLVLPQIIFWNLNGHANKPCKSNETGVACLGGFEPSIIETFLESGELKSESLPLEVIRKYLQLVTI